MKNRLWTIIVESPFDVKPYQVCGRSSKNIMIDYALNIVKCWPYEVKENKMTREEAIKIVRDRGYTVDLLNMLEALGLIKFEEKKGYVDILKAYMIDWSDFEMELKRNGFYIAKR